MSTSEILLCAPMRTAIGTFNGFLKGVPTVELGATALRAISSKPASARSGSTRPWGVTSSRPATA